MSLDQRAQVWAKTHGRCWYCGKQCNPWYDFTIDHMDPRKQGGDNELPNLVPCCKACNSRKNAKTVNEFREYLQGKGQHTFWFEHAAISFGEAHEAEIENDDTCESCEEIRNSMYNASSLPLRQNDPGMLTLLGLAYTNAGYASTVHVIAQFTNQSESRVIAHLIRLHQLKLISMRWMEQWHCHWFSIADSSFVLELMKQGIS